MIQDLHEFDMPWTPARESAGLPDGGPAAGSVEDDAAAIVAEVRAEVRRAIRWLLAGLAGLALASLAVILSLRC